MKRAILQLQRALRRRYGSKLNTDSGAGTLYINADHADMTDEVGTIVARGPAKVVTVLRRRRRK
jgi:hypothetical protein